MSEAYKFYLNFENELGYAVMSKIGGLHSRSHGRAVWDYLTNLDENQVQRFIKCCKNVQALDFSNPEQVQFAHVFEVFGYFKATPTELEDMKKYPDIWYRYCQVMGKEV